MALVKRTFTVVLQPDTEEGGYTALVPALPGCVSEGETMEEAMANAKEAIEGFLEALAKDGKPIRRLRPHGGGHGGGGRLTANASGHRVGPRTRHWRPLGHSG